MMLQAEIAVKKTTLPFSLSNMLFMPWDRTFRKGLTARPEMKCHKLAKPSTSSSWGDLETPECGNSYEFGRSVRFFLATSYPFLKQFSWGFDDRAACRREDAGVRQVCILLFMSLVLRKCGWHYMLLEEEKFQEFILDRFPLPWFFHMLQCSDIAGQVGENSQR